MRNVEALTKSLVRQGATVHWTKPHGVCFSLPNGLARYTLGGPAMTASLREPVDAHELREEIDRATDVAIRGLADAAEAGPLPDPEPIARPHAAVAPVDDPDDPFAGIHD